MNRESANYPKDFWNVPLDEKGGKQLGFWRTYIRNLIVVLLVFGGAAAFMAIFYPSSLQILFGFSVLASNLKAWPIVILSLFVFALPRRRR